MEFDTNRTIKKSKTPIVSPRNIVRINHKDQKLSFVHIHTRDDNYVTLLTTVTAAILEVLHVASV